MPAQVPPTIAPTDAAPLVAERLTKRFGRRVWALRDVDLEIATGAITALVGPNGAGKSTLIKSWIAFERPTAGHVRVAGIDPWHQRARAIRLLGYVPQAASLYRSLSVDDHLALARSLRGTFDVDLARRRLAQLAIPLDRRAGELSGGQQAQVGLAIALGTRAPILLLDEPLASLDPLARREFLAVLVEAVRADGSTALLSSHVITDIEAACDRLIVLGDGRVLLHESLATAVARHRVTGAGDAPTPGLAAIATFPDERGGRMTLWRDGSTVAGGRVATLEEVVLGYLASGRTA